MLRRCMVCLLTITMIILLCCVSAFALESTTLCNGSKGEEVRALQQALIDLGFLKDRADGIFGNKTEAAVRAFQASRNLTVDGLAGKKTRALLQEAASSGGSSSPAATTPKPETTPTPRPQATPKSETTSVSSGGSLFGGNYATIRLNDRGDRVKAMQQALISLKYLSGKADGIFGNQTLQAVLLFQKKNSLTADGLAGKKTLSALEAAYRSGSSGGNTSADPTPAPTSTPVVTAAPSVPSGTETAYTASSYTAKAPDGGTVHLMHWFNDIKSNLGNGTNLLIVDPSTGISWTLRVHSRGRHCDAEPLTKQDTENMVKAFGGKNTWDQKAVYVKLPSGVWTIGSTHDMPHMSGTIGDNGFNGHLCVHFLRDMSETKTNDPNYGVANQNTIRAFWKALTGEELAY